MPWIRWTPCSAAAVILATGCAVRSSDADIKHAPAPATIDDKPPGNHEGHDLRLEYEPLRSGRRSPTWDCMAVGPLCLIVCRARRMSPSVFL